MAKVNIADLISGIFTAVRERFLAMLGILLTFFVAQLALMAVFFGMFGLSALTQVGMAEAAPPSFGAAFLIGIFLMYFLFIALAACRAAAMNYAASPLVQASFSDALAAGIRSIPTLLGVMVIFFLAYLGGVIALVIVGAITAMLGKGAVVLLGIAIFCGAIYLASRLCVIAPVVAIDRVSNPIRAIERAWSLTQGNVGTILVTIVVLAIGSAVLLGLAFAPMLGQLMAMGPNAVPSAMAGMFGASMIGIFLVGLVLSLVWEALFAVLHAQLSDRGAEVSSDVFD